MKSKASIKSHPLHPILVAFPIAFFTGTFLFDILFLFADNEDHLTTAEYLNIAGIVGAVLAAIPGIVDYFTVVPPASSAKKRATKHGLLNSTVLIIFIVLYFRREDIMITTVHMVLETLAMILLTIAGWMGGTLVYRNQVGVDIRYASAGKWNEEYLDKKSGEIEVATTGELEVNQMKLVHINGKRIVIGKTEDGFVAFDDRCTHRGGTLAGGSMICGTVQCPWHGSQFNVTTGEVKAGPARTKITTYELTISGHKVFIRL
ncbi:MAG: hypothetical protein K0R82_1749 [Flavipsychrobacter sp.]|nr:hypothetical protein [Flavipsychrobacter sp.]